MHLLGTVARSVFHHLAPAHSRLLSNHQRGPTTSAKPAEASQTERTLASPTLSALSKRREDFRLLRGIVTQILLSILRWVSVTGNNWLPTADLKKISLLK